MLRPRAGVPGLSTYSFALTAFVALSGAFATSAAAAEPATSPVVSADEKSAPSIAAPNAAPKVELPYKIITKPVPETYSASKPALPSAAATDPVAAPAQAKAAPTVEPTVAPKEAPVKDTAATEPPAPATTASKPASPAPAPEKAQAAVVPARPAPPAITLNIDIDLTRQKMTLTEYGKVVGSWPISSGAEGHRSPTGSFRPLWQSKMWYSKQYDNAPMPHAVFFSGGVAMHGTQSVGRLGSPASHGCIRQSPSNAEKTYKLVSKHGNSHVKIVVHGKPKDDEPRVARRDRDDDTAAARYASANRYTPRAAVSRYAGEYRPQAGMRRVIMVDSNGNRRITEIPANDPRLAAYNNRGYGGGYGYSNGYNRW